MKWDGMTEIMVQVELDTKLSVRSVPTFGACMICTEVYVSGAEIGTLPIQEMLLILLVPHPAWTAWSVAAVGAASRCAAVLRTGGTTAAMATTASASASPSSPFNDWKSFSLLATA